MRSLETPDIFCTPLHFVNGRPRSTCLDDVEKLHNSAMQGISEHPHINMTESSGMSTGSCPLKALVQRPKFSISSSFSSTWRYTEFYMLELCSMCKMVTLSVGKSVCPCVMWASFDEIRATYMSSAFSSSSGDTTYSGTHRLYRCQCYGDLSFEMLCSFRYQVLAYLVSYRYLPASHLPQASRGCGREEQALRSPRSVVSGSAASQGRCARTKVLVMSELSDS